MSLPTTNKKLEQNGLQRKRNKISNLKAGIQTQHVSYTWEYVFVNKHDLAKRDVT